MARRTPPDSTRERPSREVVRRASRPAMYFALTLLAAMWLTALPTGMVLAVVTAVLAVAAVALGGWSLVRLRRAKVRGFLWWLVIVAFGVALFVALSSIVQLAMWDVYANFSDCMRKANTSQAEASCRGQLEDDIRRWALSLVG